LKKLAPEAEAVEIARGLEKGGTAFGSPRGRAGEPVSGDGRQAMAAFQSYVDFEMVFPSFLPKGVRLWQAEKPAGRAFRRDSRRGRADMF